VPTHRRWSRFSIAILCAASGCFAAAGSSTPAYASIGSERAQERAQEHAVRAAERLARAEERKAARAQLRAERLAARAERRLARRRARGERESAHPQAPGEGSNAPAEGTPAGDESEAPATPTAAALRGCTVTVTASARVVTAGETATITGVVNCPEDVPAAARKVTIYESQPGVQQAAATPVTTASAAADGSYSFTSEALAANTLFRVHIGRSGAHTMVKVAPRVTLGMAGGSSTTTVLAGSARRTPRERVTFLGTVAPYQAGAQVELQVAYASAPDQWRTVAYGEVGQDGSYSITHGFHTPGQTMVRAVAHAGKHKVAAASETLAYDAAQPQNPKLTIFSTPDPVTAGQTVTITGVAAGGPGQTVSLLARTLGGPATQLATATTDSEGNYTFTQSPLQSTYYRVIDSSTASTLLFEPVRLAVLPDAITEAVKVGQPVTFTGAIVPSGAGLPVRLERENVSGTGFIPVASAVCSEESRYEISSSFAKPGTYTLRVKVPNDGKHAASASAPFTIEVTA
jgi:hypothetical protein